MTSQLKTFMLLALLSGLIIVLGGALGGKTGIVIAFGLALIMNVGSYWYSDKNRPEDVSGPRTVGKRSPHDLQHGARAGRQRPDPHAAHRRGSLKKPPTAFATGRNPENSVVAVTEGILRLLSPGRAQGRACS